MSEQGKIEITSNEQILRNFLYAIYVQFYKDYVHDLVLIATSKQDETIFAAEKDKRHIEQAIKGVWFERKFLGAAEREATLRIMEKKARKRQKRKRGRPRVKTD